jgi:hypothetical protein
MKERMKGRGRKLFGISVDMSAADGTPGEPLDTGAADRDEGLQRVQVGLFGIAAMVLLVGLASIIGTQADLADEAAVPDAAPTTEPRPALPAANPLADAGVVPDMPLEPSPAPLLDPLVLPPPTSAPITSPSARPKS